MNGMALSVTKLRQVFTTKSGDHLEILNLEKFNVPAGGQVAVTGPSGSGKTTLLHALTGIEKTTSGSICWNDLDLSHMGENDRDRWRRDHVGMIFQDFYLFDGMSILQNVLLPFSFDKRPKSTDLTARAKELLKTVGAPDDNRRIELLSRGERQRVAIARALITSPKVILADEPTASLDRDTAQKVIDLLITMTFAAGATLIAVTHDALLIERLPLVYRLLNGQLTQVKTSGKQGL